MPTFFFRAFIAGGIAACGAVTVTHSFETVKIRYVKSRALRIPEANLVGPGYNYRESYKRRPMWPRNIREFFME